MSALGAARKALRAWRPRSPRPRLPPAGRDSAGGVPSDDHNMGSLTPTRPAREGWTDEPELPPASKSAFLARKASATAPTWVRIPLISKSTGLQLGSDLLKAATASPGHAAAEDRTDVAGPAKKHRAVHYRFGLGAPPDGMTEPPLAPPAQGGG